MLTGVLRWHVCAWEQFPAASAPLRALQVTQAGAVPHHRVRLALLLLLMLPAVQMHQLLPLLLLLLEGVQVHPMPVRANQQQFRQQQQQQKEGPCPAAVGGVG